MNIDQQIKTVENQLAVAVQSLAHLRSTKQCDYIAESFCCTLEYNRIGLVKARNAIRKYGEAACKTAYAEHQKGNGATTVGGGNANVGDALICGGEYLLTGNTTYFKASVEF